MKAAARAVKKLYDSCPALFVFLISMMLTVSVEALGRRSLIDSFGFIIHQPVMFIYNMLIIFATLAVCLLCRRRIFIITLISIAWLTCGITNCVMLGYRTTPFSAVDLQLFTSIASIIKIYMKPWQIVLSVLALAAGLGAVILVGIKAPRYKGKIPYFKYFSALSITMLSVYIAGGTVNADSSMQSNFPNIADAYEEYGFAYCFSNSLLDQGIDRPDDYSKEYMDMLKGEIDSRSEMNVSTAGVPGVIPNIIMVQLESFLDVNYIKGVEFSENPVPNFTWLKSNFPHGFLTVPAIGSGTVNTEFEILTGMSLDYFGASEYPYKSELVDKTFESICYDLKKYGYFSHAIHNNEGTFYDRNKVFPNLGFDTFTSMEYMDGIEFNSLGWPHDDVLVDETYSALSKTKEQDFVYAISVQPHGKYPEEYLEDAPYEIKSADLTGILDENIISSYDYYINQLNETDRVIKEFTDFYENYEEPVVIVFFGDHFPNLELEDEDLEKGDLFTTEYAIWSNYSLNAPDKDLTAFGMSSHIFEILGLNGGYLNGYNRYFENEADYPSGLQYLGYDMLYGDNYEAELPADMSMGTKLIRILGTEVSVNTENEGKYDVTVSGENFTPYSVVILNGKEHETEYINSETLVVRDMDEPPQTGDILTVAQIGADTEVLSVTEDFVC